MAITASVQPESGRIVYTGSDFPHPFSSVFPKKAWAIVCKTDPDPISRAWPGFGYTRIWSGLKAGWCARIIWFGFWQDATGLLLVSHFQTPLSSSTDVLDNIQIQPGASLVLADCSSFGPTLFQFWANIVPVLGQTDPVRK